MSKNWLQAEKEKHLQTLSAATEAQQQAEHSAAQDKQRADVLQHQLAAAQQKQQRSLLLRMHQSWIRSACCRLAQWLTCQILKFVAEALRMMCRLRSSHKAQASALEKSRSVQDDMADVLLSLKVCCIHNKGHNC